MLADSSCSLMGVRVAETGSGVTGLGNDEAVSLLHAAYPLLSMRHLELGRGPTPVRRLDTEPGFTDLPQTWVKDESTYGERGWGGNKVRKLEWILPEAARRGTRTLFTVGGIGTHWGLAAALYGAEQGLRVVLGLVDQPVDDHVREQVARLVASGAIIHRFTDQRRLRLAAPLLIGRYRAWYLPAGGSNPIGTIGYVEAALELADQVVRGEVPEPGTVVVPLGSGGTTAGLVLGLRMAGLGSRVLGVVVNDTFPLDGPVIAGLANKTLALLKTRGAPISMAGIKPEELDLRTDWLGRTYGDPTPESLAEVAAASQIGMQIEPVYTGKSLAAIRAVGHTLPGPILWLNTHGPR